MEGFQEMDNRDRMEILIRAIRKNYQLAILLNSRISSLDQRGINFL